MEEQNINEETPKEEVSSSDESTSKVVAILGYLVPIIFFIPLLSEEGKKNTFAMHHANQHLNMLISWLAINMIAIIPLLGWLVWFVGAIALLVFTVMGIINAAGGSKKSLPVVGGWTLLK